MNVTLIGDAERPVIAVVGTWDPFPPDCERLLAQLIGSEHARGIGAAAIMLDPPPKVHLEGEHAFPLFHDSVRRVDLLQRSGVDVIVRIGFSREDLHRTAADFFDAVCPHLHLEEFWIRHGQDLGRNVGGSGLAVSMACRKHSIRLHLLAKNPQVIPTDQARDWFARGCVRAAAQIAGCKPSFRRPPGGILGLAWPAGRYELAEPSDVSRFERALATRMRDSMSAFRWILEYSDVLEVVRDPGLRDHELVASGPVSESSAADARIAVRRATLIQEICHASGAPSS